MQNFILFPYVCFFLGYTLFIYNVVVFVRFGNVDNSIINADEYDLSESKLVMDEWVKQENNL